MKADDQHIAFFKNLKTPQQRSQEDIWAKIEEDINENPPKTIHISWTRWVAAAVLIVLVSSISFMRLYSIEINALENQKLSHQLPDGSIIGLNTESSVSYHPYWWWAKRSIDFSGEGFFEVETGKNFRIVSENGITEVLGTSFNILARDYKYEVYCKTGMVRVSSTKTDIHFIIEPNEIAIIDNINLEGHKVLAQTEDLPSWKDIYFNFESLPLNKVLAALESQYKVSIELSDQQLNNLSFTAYFEKPDSAEEALDLICQTFNLTFDKVNENNYKVSSLKN